MVSLNWGQVNAWRLSQHSLLPRVDQQKLIEIVAQLGGVQAQVMSAAELALGTRIDGLTPTDVQDALWYDRTLIKTWAMRGTLHLLTASEFPLYVAAHSTRPIRRPPSYYTYHGVTPNELEAIIAGVPETLTDVPMTREQMAEAIAQRAGKPHVREVLLSGWGALLKPSAWRGDLCFGPNQGQNVTFVRPGRWIGEWQPMEAQEALKEITRRYLRAYGPATPDDFARWWGTDASQAKKVFRSLGDEIVPVEVEGWQAWALISTLETLKTVEAPHSVRLLPQFDTYILGLSRDCEPLLDKAYKSRVYWPQGWISAVVLVDGRMEGVWEYEPQRSHITVKVGMFAPPTAAVKQGIRAEAERLGQFLGAEAEIVYT